MRPAIKRVLLSVEFAGAANERLLETFDEAEHVRVRATDEAALLAAAQNCDVAILRRPPPLKFFSSERLGWVHIDQSGLDRVATPEICNGKTIVTSSSGRSAPVLAEHAVFFMLSLVYHSRVLESARRRRTWAVRGYGRLLGLARRHVLIVGWGHTGRELAKRCLALDMRVTVFTRSALRVKPDNVRFLSIENGDGLDEALLDVDVLALAASLNDTSYEMFGADQLALLNRGALVVNVARAELVCPNALKAALSTGQIGGLGTDVAHQEPMPPWNAIWRHPNVIITPHITPRLSDREERTVSIIAENLALYQSGQPLANALRPQDVLTKRPTTVGVEINGWDQRRVARGVGRVWSRIFRPRIVEKGKQS